MRIYKFLSPFKQTNNYIVDVGENQFIGIDIGLIESDKIMECFNKTNGELIAFFITHSHADHSFGIREIYDKFRIPVYCTQACAEELMDSRKNLSYYLDDIETFEYDIPFKKIADNTIQLRENLLINTISVPGHSAGCMCVKIENTLFTGDFLMESKTPLNFRTSNRKSYSNSLNKINQMFKNEEIVCYPGHGNSFVFSDRLSAIQSC
jgi:glyoxylase-like metal-dependent hydrolase (beta-lactamase superfamily II)